MNSFNREKKVGIDLDEVLAETIDYILEYNQYKLGDKIIRKEDITDYYIHRIFDHIDLEYAKKWFWGGLWSDKKNLAIRPVLGAKEILKEMKKNDYKLSIITARRQDLFWEYTIKRVKKYFSQTFEDIIFADHLTENEKSKSSICRENGITHMIEDNFYYAKELAENGIQTQLIEKPWNRHIKEEHENIIKIKSWGEINIF